MAVLWWFFVTSLIKTFIVSNFALYECPHELSCANDSISTIHTSNDSGIACRGYKSCWHASSIKTDNKTYCAGGWSCENTNTIVTNNLLCRATNGCSDITNITLINTLGAVDCAGVKSCTNSQFRYTNPDHLSCFGDSSCQNVILNNAKDIGFYGEYSAIGAVINPNGTIVEENELIVGFWGYFSGYNATVHCWSGQTCEIECFGNGCFGVNVICAGGSICNFNCDNGILCPNKDSPNATFIAPKYDIIEQTTQYEQLCETDPIDSMVDTRCMDFLECTNREMDIDLIGDGIFDSICCVADSSCENMDLLSVNSDYDIICSAHESCMGSIIQGSGKYSNSSVYCHGSDSCFGSTISDISKIYCGAHWGCHLATLQNVDTIFCSGFISCEGVIFYDVNTIYITATQALTRAMINTTSTEWDCDNVNNINIEILTADAVEDLEIYCNSGNKCNINCGVYGACDDSIMIYCVGEGNDENNCNVTCDVSDSSLCPTVVSTGTAACFNYSITDSGTSTRTIATTAATTAVTTGTTAISTTTETTGSMGTINTSTDTGNELETGARYDQLSTTYNYLLWGGGCFVLVLLITSYIDAKCIRENEQFRTSGIIFAAAYSFDFLSGVFNLNCACSLVLDIGT